MIDGETLVTKKPKRNLSSGIGLLEVEDFSVDMINSPDLIQDLNDFELSM